MKKNDAFFLVAIFLNVVCMQFIPAPAEAQQLISSTENVTKVQASVTIDGCPAENPVDCGNGRCCAENTVCVADQQCCPASMPYYCGNFMCAVSASDCPASGCPAKTVLGEDNQKLENLRAFRDSNLAKSAIGRKVIAIYYTNAGSINAAMNHSPALRGLTRRVLETIAPLLESKQN